MKQLYNALIKTHHITSRKKLARLQKATDAIVKSKERVTAHVNCTSSSGVHMFVLLRSGGSPGLMYVESDDEDGVREWVAAVQRLRYKDFSLLCRPSGVTTTAQSGKQMGFHEVSSVAEFARCMQERGLLDWWRNAMGYTTNSSEG